MAFLIGTDEAGYGPNLGPLTVSGTLWNVPETDVNLYQFLEEVISDTPIRGRLPIADSKILYRSSGSIETLETSVLSVLYGLTNRIPSSWQELTQMVCGFGECDFESEAWLEKQSLQLPISAKIETIKELGSRFRISCTRSRVELLQVRCCPVFPTRFNQGILHFGNKASLLSCTTLELISELKKNAYRGNCESDLKIVCDKHGGRSKYLSLLSDWLTDEFIWVVEEGLNISSYYWKEDMRKISAQFVARGESFLPTALASMVSKYIREVFMELWNRFWILQLPNLKPTKGYPQDAKRFKREIAPLQKSLGIADESIWRSR